MRFFFSISEFIFSLFLIDFGGARLFLTSKSSSSRFFALDSQIFRSVRRLERKISQDEAPRACKSPTGLRAEPGGKTHPYMSGQPLPCRPFGELGASNDLNLTLKNMTLNDLILKEFGFQLKAKIEVFSKVFACADAT